MSEIFDKIKKQVDSPAQIYDTQFDQTNQVVSLFDKIRGERASEKMSGYQVPGFELEKYSPYLGEMFDPLSNIDERRAQSQTTGQLIKGFTGQLASEALIGMGEAVGYALDFEEIFNADAQSQEGYDNWFSEIMRNAKEHVQEEWTPLYMTEEAQSGSFWDRLTEPTWWASQGKTFGTTLALMGPSVLVGAGATALSGGLGAGAAAPIIGAMASAMFSRKSESTMEANQAFQEEYQKYINEGKGDTKARELAGKTAATVFKANAAMIGVDFVQYLTLTKAFAPLKGILESSKTAKALNFGFQMGSEAGEEAYQYIAQQEGIRGVREGVTPFGTGFSDRVSDYIQDPEFQTSAFMGAVTGGLFESLGGIAKKVNEGIERAGVNKTIAANLGDIDSFKKIDNNTQAKIIARALVTDKIDRVISTANATLESYKNKEGVSPEELSEVETKLNKLVENAQYVKNADEELKTSNTDYAANPNTRKRFALLKYEDKVNAEYMLDLENELNGAKSKAGIDPRDILYMDNLELTALKNTRNRIEQSDLNEKDKASELSKLDLQIEAKQGVVDGALKTLKQDTQYTNFKLDDYSSPITKQYLTTALKLKLADINKTQLRKEIAQYEKKSATQIKKEEQDIIAKRNKKAAKTTASNLTTADQVTATVNESPIASDITEAVDAEAVLQPKPNYTGNVTTEKLSTEGLTPEELSGGIITAEDLKGKPAEEKELKKWLLPDYTNTPHLEAKDVAEIKDKLFKLNYSVVNEFLADKNNAKDINAILETLYTSYIAFEVSDIVGKFLTDKQLDKLQGEETVTVFTSPTAITEAVEAEATETQEVSLLAVAPRYTVEKGKIVASEQKTPVDDKDFSYEFNDDPKSLPQDFEVSFEINFEGEYNKKAVKWENGTITNPDSVQILTVYYDSKGIRHTLAVLTNTIGLEDKITSDVKERLDNLRKVIIEEAIKNKKNGEITKTGISAISKRTPGLFNTTTESSPVTSINKKALPNGELLIGIVRYNKESGVNINTPNNEEFHEPFVDRQVGSVVVWVRGVNGEVVPARAFTKNFRQIQNDNESLYNKEVQAIKDILSGINKDNVEEQIKELQNYFFTPYMIKKDKTGNIVSITFNKNKIAQSIQNLRAAKVADKKNGTNTFRALKNKLKDFYNLSETEFDDIIRGNTVFVSDKYARFNFTVNIENTKNKTTDLNSAYSLQFEEFIGDLVHQVDVDKVNTNTVKSGRKYKYNNALKDYVYVNFNTEQPTTSPKFYLNHFKYPEIAKEVEKISESKSEVNTATLLGAPSTESFEELTTKSGVEPDTESKGLQDKEGVIETETDLTKEQIETVRKKGRINLGDVLPRKVTSTSKKQATTKEQSIQKELEWLKKNLPVDDKVKLEIVDALIQIGNEQAWGTFQYNLITIYNRAIKGTVYHEGFHAVFNMALSQNDRIGVLDEAKKKYGNLSDRELEERLADDFAEYIISMEYSGKSLTEKIKVFFRRLYNFFKYNLFRNNTVNELFYNINTGKYRKAEFTPRDVDIRTKGLNYVESKQQASNIASMMSDILDDYASKKEHKGKSRKQVLDSLATNGFSGIEVLAVQANNMLYDKWENHPDYEKDTYIDNLFGITVGNFLDVTQSEEGTTIAFKKLGKDALKRFSQTEMLNFTLNSGDNFANEDITPDTNDIEEQESELDRKEHWMVVATEISLKTKVGGEIRSTLSRINKVDKEGKPVSDILGVTQYLDYNQAFATLIRELEGKTSSEDMLNELEEFVEIQPEYGALLTKLRNDEQLRTKFWNALQNVHMDFRILNEEVDRKTKKKRFIWLSANRQNVTQSILNLWRENINNSSVNKALTDTQEQRDKELESFKKAILNLKGNNLTKEEKQKKNIAFAEYLGKYGIDVTVDELNALMEVESRKRGSTGTLYDRFLTLISTTMSNVIQGFDPVSKNLDDTKQAAKLIGRLRPDYMESSFRDLKNKTNYSHISICFIFS